MADKKIKLTAEDRASLKRLRKASAERDALHRAGKGKVMEDSGKYSFAVGLPDVDVPVRDEDEAS